MEENCGGRKFATWTEAATDWTEPVTAVRNRVEWRKQVNGPILPEES